MNAQFSILVRQFTKLELADGDYVSADDVSVPAPLDTSDSGLLVAPPRERAACACDQHVCVWGLCALTNRWHLHETPQNWAYSQSFAQLCYDPVPSLVLSLPPFLSEESC